MKNTSKNPTKNTSKNRTKNTSKNPTKNLEGTRLTAFCLATLKQWRYKILGGALARNKCNYLYISTHFKIKFSVIISNVI